MWTHEESIEIAATPSQVWRLLADVPNWKRWNAGIESIEIHGPFAAGTTFTMKPPGVDAFTSTLVDVRENENFTDETVIDGTRFVVHHALSRLPSGNVRVSYSTEISGPAAAEFGPIITADFPDVLAALKRLAESSK
jgi:carbon monoxide dehydrogenase subunit G